MFPKDSITHIADSVSRIKSDSALLMDTLANSDSIVKSDSIKATLSTVPHGMEGVAHPALPMNDPWMFAILAALFLLLVAGIIPSTGQFFANIKFFASKKDSTTLFTASTVNLVRYKIFSAVFSVLVFGLTFYEVLYKNAVKFELKTPAIFCGIVVAYFIVKRILFEMIGNTFFRVKTTREYTTMYFGMLNILATLFFPVLILYIYQDTTWQLPLEITLAVFTAGFYILLIIKLFQIFYSKLLDLFYIFLYLCTLEILPVLFFLRVYEIVI